MPRARTLTLPVPIADEIAAAAARAERSIGFLVLGALKAAGPLKGDPPAAPDRALELTVDEDDPRDLLARLAKLAAERAPGRSLDHATALAWSAGRAQILAWVERVAAVNAGARADDLDDGLRAAADATTAPDRLVALAKSAYPRVRALVAAHPRAPEEALAQLRADRDRVVRETLAAR